MWAEELMLRGNLKQWVCLFKSRDIKINHLWFYFRKWETEEQIKSKASGIQEINTRAKPSEIENRSIAKINKTRKTVLGKGLCYQYASSYGNMTKENWHALVLTDRKEDITKHPQTVKG